MRREWRGEDPLTGVEMQCGGARLWLIGGERPWLMSAWELLDTKAPNPSICEPFCCYLRTVIFYVTPYVVRPWHLLWMCNGERRAQKPGQHFEEWGRCETVLSWDDKIDFRGERFKVGGGSVVWKHKRWWMRHRARRICQDATDS